MKKKQAQTRFASRRADCARVDSAQAYHFGGTMYRSNAVALEDLGVIKDRPGKCFSKVSPSHTDSTTMTIALGPKTRAGQELSLRSLSA